MNIPPSQFGANEPGGQPLTLEESERLVHELQVHQVELEVQNAELRDMQLALETSRSQFVDLYDLAPVGYCTVGEDGLIVRANVTLANMLGLARQDLLYKRLSRFFVNEDRDIFYRLRRNVAQGATALAPQPASEQSPVTNAGAEVQPYDADASSCEVRMVRGESATPFWALLAARLVPDERGGWDLRLSLQDISARKQAQQAMQVALNDKEALLHEVHHRVKNNLQVIASLLRLESSRSDQAQTRSVLADMQSRIRAMALLHETMYRSDTFASVDLGSYLTRLAGQTAQMMLLPDGRVRLRVEAEPVQVSMDQATTCGMLVNELVSNSFKHGFVDGRGGDVYVTLHAQPANAKGQPTARLCVRDSGIGLGTDFDYQRCDSLGLRLVGDLSVQLGGVLEICDAYDVEGAQGAQFSVTFVVAPLKPSKILE